MPPHKTEPKKWKPPKGPKNTPHKNKNTIGLGRSIKNVKQNKDQVYYLPDGEMRFTTEKKEAGWVKLRSVTHENALDDFLNTAELADTDFQADRGSSVKIIKVNNTAIDPTTGLGGNYNPYLLSTQEESEKFAVQKEHQNELTVPRRPKWDTSMTKFELEKLESEAFLEWRRELAQLSENHDLLLTPFERNIMVWKQLWRVVERSDLIVQIVDARNPLLFRSIDLEKYVKETNPLKRNLLLVNKADLLNYEQRLSWARYFNENGIKYTFFSAAKANEILEKQRLEEEAIAQGLIQTSSVAPKPKKNKKKTVSIEDELDALSDEFDEDDLDDLDEEERAEILKLQEEYDQLRASMKGMGIDEKELNKEDEDDFEEFESEEEQEDQSEMTRILTVDELEALFLREAPDEPLTEAPEGQPQRLQIGLVGYPNVGKSSTINALVGSKKVSVSATPGKTKHFQTILLSDDVILCDCPGLVFPNFAYTNGELVCNGVLPIDQLREVSGPCQLVSQRIPKYFIEATYGITIHIRPIDEGGSGIPTSQELLNSYARSRGYMTQGFGSADESRAARYILKDYVGGKLLYVEPPPREDGSRLSAEECLKFNKGLYTLDRLPEQRQKQLIQAIKDKNLNVKEFDLAKDLNKLTFSSHVSTEDALKSNNKHSRTHGGKQAALINSAEDLDEEFFKMSQVKGNLKPSFHRNQSNMGGKGNKKHNKGNKKKAKKDASASIAAILL